jgi:hypothetical protein
MDNQHRKIAGYRELDKIEIDLINAIKLKAEEVSELVKQVQALPMGSIETSRWSAIAKTELQQGFMALVRAVALPQTF